MAQEVASRLGIVSIDNNSGTLTLVTGETAKISGLGAISRTVSKRTRGLSSTTQIAIPGPLELPDVTITLYMGTLTDNAKFRDYVAWASSSNPTSRTVSVDFPVTAVGNDRVAFEAIPVSITPGDLDDQSSEPLMYTLVLSCATTPAWSVQ